MSGRKPIDVYKLYYSNHISFYFYRMEPQQPELEITKDNKNSSRLRLLFKIAFICNICFLICMVMRYSSAPKYLPQPIIELSIILGWSAILVNVVSFVMALILISRIRTRKIPLWLLYTNIVFFIAQFYFFFILHD
ncbi:MAG: hypothetical protein JST21_15025 [Bacteroidetes bacterium]|nr:hypothetical protein [Bacteroidota bacterium]